MLRQGVRRTAVLLDIMRSEEFRRTLHRPAHPSTLPNLVVQRPERYRRTTDRVNGSSMLVFNVESPADFDWLEHAIIANGYYEEPGVWILDVDFDKRLVAEMLAAFAPSAALELGLRGRRGAAVPRRASGSRARGSRSARWRSRRPTSASGRGSTRAISSR